MTSARPPSTTAAPGLEAPDESEKPMAVEGDSCEACLDVEDGTLPMSCCTCCVVPSKAPTSDTMSLAFGDPGAEKVTAELEQRAVMEAERLLSADGRLCLERLALLRKTFEATFVSRVLARCPSTALMELLIKECEADAINTALLLEDYREIRLWQESPETTQKVFPDRLISLYDIPKDFGAGSIETWLAQLKARLVPSSFMENHPSTEVVKERTKKTKGKGRGRGRGRGRGSQEQHVSDDNDNPSPVATKAEFESLLRALSRGCLEGVPFGLNTVLLGGSSMAWCTQRPTERLRQILELEHQAWQFEKQLGRMLEKRVGRICASRILHMARSSAKDLKGDPSDPALSAWGYWELIAQDFLTNSWKDADIDLFVVASTDTEKVVHNTVNTLQHNIKRLCGGKADSIVLKTRNTLTVAGVDPFPIVQVVCKTVRSCAELLVHADVDCTSMAYDGEKVWTTVRALRSLACGYNFIPKMVVTGFGPRISKSGVRFAKYYQRGFGIMVFEHCRHVPRCDYSVPEGAMDRLKGLRTPVFKTDDLKGTPHAKGKTAAEWMCIRSPDLRRRAKADAEAEAEAASSSVPGVRDLEHDPLSDRIVPGDRLQVAGGHTREEADRRESKTPSRRPGGRGAPLLHYNTFVDIVIPSGPKICSETLKSYVAHLKRPDLLDVVTSSDITIAPKSRSDRAQWQDFQRGKCYLCRQQVADRKQKWPLCEACSSFNKAKREASCDMTGKVALITGGRVKIGLRCALKLLRANCTVVVTTRFPRNALDTFQKETDFKSFEERLLILPADFRHLRSVQQLVTIVLDRFDRLDVLIHNAAQTIHRPPAYYDTLRKKEEELAAIVPTATSAPASSTAADEVSSSAAANQEAGSQPASANIVTQALSLLPVSGELTMLSSDVEAELNKAELFPAGKTDAHGDQLDLRKVTSWTLKLEDVEVPELAEVLAINLVVPYVLTARLLPLLRKTDSSFVVFVSSQEGSFTAPNGTKNCQHPHTNVAKAGLNMLCRTIAPDFRKDGIFASVVDPGWVSWMKPGGSGPVERAPLSEDDGAARVMDPIFAGLEALKQRRCPPSGVLFKDFRVAAW